MASFAIILTTDAVADLVQIRNYIADVLLAPTTALSYIRAIRKEINTLSDMPNRIKTVDDEPLHSNGIRKIVVKNFYIYFRIDEDAKKVYILNIIYTKRDQLRQLGNTKAE